MVISLCSSVGIGSQSGHNLVDVRIHLLVVFFLCSFGDNGHARFLGCFHRAWGS